METNFYPSRAHQYTHKAVCAIGLLVALGLGIPAVIAVTSRISTSHSLQSWCSKVGCVSVPTPFASDPLVVTSGLEKEAQRTVAQLYVKSTFPFLDLAPPRVETSARPQSQLPRVGRKAKL